MLVNTNRKMNNKMNMNRVGRIGQWVAGVMMIGMVSGNPEAWGVDREGTGEAEVNTFSIVARDVETGDFGVAVQSRFFGVGSVVPWGQADTGVVATQSWANTQFGPQGLELMQRGKSAAEALAELIQGDEKREFRQVALVDQSGNVAVHTGAECLAYAGHKTGEHYAVQGNLLASERVLEAMEKAYLTDKTEAMEKIPFCSRLMNALKAGQEAGGDKRGMQSAAILVVRRNGGYGGLNDRFIDLRVEDSATPIDELARLLEMHQDFYRNEHQRKMPVRE